jgi:CheY-like chemotaxis protein
MGAVAMGLSHLFPLMRRDRAGEDALRAVVIVDPAERSDLPRLREQGFNGYLVRPIRPVSLLTQLFGHLDGQQGETVTSFPPPPARAADDLAPKISVLLAEDNDINALLARTVLEKSGVRVVHVRNGSGAIAAARHELALSPRHGFDLVLMDIHMPDMDGVESARGIRALYPADARPADGRPPIVALTANAFAEDRASYLAAGLDDYLAKPFERQDLAALLARWGKPLQGAKKAAGRGAA